MDWILWGSGGCQQPYEQVLDVPHFIDKEVGTPRVWEPRHGHGSDLVSVNLLRAGAAAPACARIVKSFHPVSELRCLFSLSPTMTMQKFVSFCKMSRLNLLCSALGMGVIINSIQAWCLPPAPETHWEPWNNNKRNNSQWQESKRMVLSFFSYKTYEGEED